MLQNGNWPYHEIVILENTNYIIGGADGLTAHLHVQGDDAEAFIVGYLGTTCDGGSVSVTCCTGTHPCSTNILIFYVSNDGYDWSPIISPPYIYVTWASLAEYYVASFSQSFSYVAVCTWSPSTEDSSCLSVDSITVTTGGSWDPPYPPEMQIRVGNQGEGGSVDPEGWINLLYYPYDNVNITATPDPNYELDYWIINGDFENPINGENNPLTVPACPSLVEAYFRNATRTLTVLPRQDGFTTPPEGEYEYYTGTPVAVSAYSDNSYVLDYWLLNGYRAFAGSTIHLNMNTNYTLQPVFREATEHYSLTLICGGNGSTSPSPGITTDILEGSLYNATATPNPGYWVYWRLDGNFYSYEQTVTVPVLRNHTLQACFVSSQLDQDFGNTELLDSMYNVEIIRGEIFNCTTSGWAQSITVPINCYSTNGYEYIRYAIYSLDSGELLAQTEIGMVPSQIYESEPIWVTLNFSWPQPILQAQTPYLLCVFNTKLGTEPNDGIFIFCRGGPEEPVGFNIVRSWSEYEGEFPQSCLEGYWYGMSYYEWSLDYTNYNIYCTVRPFVPAMQYCLTVSSDGCGSTAPQSGLHFFDENTVVFLNATADVGYAFDHWLIDDNTVEFNPVFFAMKQNHTAVAYFC